MRILIIGAGAVGGYFGGRLAQAGVDVTFLVRPKRADQLKTTGLKIISPYGNVTITPQLVVTGSIAMTYDIVLLTVKAYALEQASNDFAPAVGTDTIIVPFLNGMRHLDLLIARFGKKPVFGGVCNTSTMLKDDGSILQMGDTQSLSYGELDGALTSRVKNLDQVFKGKKFMTRLSQNIVQEMWEKWVFLATLGGMTCLLRGSIGEIEAVPGGVALIRQLFAECSAVSVAYGFSPAPVFVSQAQAILTARGSRQTSSMYRDLVNGRLVEADHIIGDLLERAKNRGVPTPLLAVAFMHLKIYQNRLSVNGEETL